MKNKLEQLNQSYKKALGRIIPKLLSDELIIISDVLVAQNYRSARVWVKCGPEQIEKLRAKRREVQTTLKRFLRSRYIIVLEFLPDDDLIETMDKLFEKVVNEN